MLVSKCNCWLDSWSGQLFLMIRHKDLLQNTSRRDSKARDSVQVSLTGKRKIGALKKCNLALLHKYRQLQILLLTDIMAPAARLISHPRVINYHY